MAEGARLESVCGGNLTVGSNPTLSANFFHPDRTGPARDEVPKMALDERVTQYYALFSERKLKELEALFTDDSIIIDFRGTEHHSTGVVRMFELYPGSAKFELLRMTQDDRSVNCDFRVTGGPPSRASQGNDLFVFYGEKIRVLKTTLPLL